MKILKLTDADYDTCKQALQHAECWMCYLINNASDETVKEWAQDKLKSYLEIGFNVDVLGE